MTGHLFMLQNIHIWYFLAHFRKENNVYQYTVHYSLAKYGFCSLVNSWINTWFPSNTCFCWLGVEVDCRIGLSNRRIYPLAIRLSIRIHFSVIFILFGIDLESIYNHRYPCSLALYSSENTGNFSFFDPIPVPAPIAIYTKWTKHYQKL